MTRATCRRIAALLASAAAGFGVWKWVPGTDWDRRAFETVAASFANPPLFVSGSGKSGDPWRLASFTSNFKTDARQAPVIVSLGDGAADYFQSFPPAPIDFAVIFSNFHRLGTRKLATAAVLAWEDPDLMGLAALEKSLGSFESLAMAQPLTFGPVAAPVPPAFRRGSIALASVHGDFSKLPQVNGLQIPNAILGGSATAGFSALPLAENADLPPLLARWDDRVVLAFSLVTVIQRLGVAPEKLEVRLGEYLRLGPGGPVLPLDEYGRLTLPLRSAAPLAVIRAEELIDGGDDLFPRSAPEPLILRDDQSASDPATRDFSAGLSKTIAAMASEDNLAERQTFPRLIEPVEAGTLAGVAVLAALAAGLAKFPRRVTLGVIGAAAVAAQWIGFGTASVWLPGMAMLAGVVAAGLAAAIFQDRKSAEREIPVAEELPGENSLAEEPFVEEQSAEGLAISPPPEELPTVVAIEADFVQSSWENPDAGPLEEEVAEDFATEEYFPAGYFWDEPATTPAPAVVEETPPDVAEELSEEADFAAARNEEETGGGSAEVAVFEPVPEEDFPEEENIEEIEEVGTEVEPLESASEEPVPNREIPEPEPAESPEPDLTKPWEETPEPAPQAALAQNLAVRRPANEPPAKARPQKKTRKKPSKNRRRKP